MAEKALANEHLSSTLENYLEIIFYEESKEGAARSGSIADTANVARSTMTSALKTLHKMGYITYAPYSLIHLTPEGKKIGSAIAHKHRAFREFFHTILQLDQTVADNIACKMEHVIDDSSFKRFIEFVYYMSVTKEKWENWQEEYKELKKIRTKEVKTKNEKNKVQKEIINK